MHMTYSQFVVLFITPIDEQKKRKMYCMFVCDLNLSTAIFDHHYRFEWIVEQTIYEEKKKDEVYKVH